MRHALHTVMFALLLGCATCFAQQRQADQLLLLAVQQYDARKYQEAYDILRQAERLDPENDAVKYYLGNILAMSGNKEEALKRFREAYVRDSTNVWYGMQLASQYNELRRPAAAIAILEKLQKLKPNSPEIISCMMDSQLMTGGVDIADSLLNRLEMMSGESDYTRLTRLEILRQKGDFPKFFASMNTLFREGYMPGSSKVELIRRVLHSCDPRFNYAHLQDYMTLTRTCLEVHPADTAVAHFAVGMLMSADKDEALALCEAFPKDSYMVSAAISIYSGRENFKAVLKEADKLLALSADDTEARASAHAIKGDAYQYLGQKEKAFREYEQSLQLVPDNISVLNNYAYFMACEGKNLSKCAKMSKKTIEAEPQNATYLDTYAWILYKQKKYALAKSYFKKAMMYGGKNSAAILEHYADTLDALGEATLARAYREQAQLKNNEDK